MINNQLWTPTAFPNSGITANDNDGFGQYLVAGNFNGDGYYDLAIGMHRKFVKAQYAGAINILHGSGSGLTSRGSQSWSQGDLKGNYSEYDDNFGNRLAVGDFNNDGYDDLAVGVPFEDWGTITDSGAVNIIYGSSSGLSSNNNITWFKTDRENYDDYGEALATGDFNNDGYDDLAIGIPGEDLDGYNKGQVNILYGSDSGLTGGPTLTQDDLGGSRAEDNDRLGETLAAGDFNGDGYDDLAVGVPFEDWGTIKDSGVVNIIYGSSSGLSSNNKSQIFNQNIFPSGGNNSKDRFGETLAAGDFNGDGYDDLAVGVPFEGYNDAGVVNILHGSVSGLTSRGSQSWTQDDLSGSSTETDDRFGTTLAVGDFNNDGYDDLAVGASYEDWGDIENAGAVNIIYGSRLGLTSTNNKIWTQEHLYDGSSAEPNDYFGFGLTAKDFNNDGFDDLAIGSHGEDVVHILYGSENGLVV